MAPLQRDPQLLGGRVVTSRKVRLSGLGQHRQRQVNSPTDDRQAPRQILGEAGPAERIRSQRSGRTEQPDTRLPGALETLGRDHAQVLPRLGLAQGCSHVVAENHRGAAVQARAGLADAVAVEHAAALGQSELQLHAPGPRGDSQIELQGRPLPGARLPTLVAVDLTEERGDRKRTWA